MPKLATLTLEQPSHGRLQLSFIECVALHAYIGRIVTTPPPVGQTAEFTCGSVTITATSAP